MMEWLLWQQCVSSEDITSGRIAAYLAGGGQPFTAKCVAGGGIDWPGGHHFYASPSSRQKWPDKGDAREGWRAWIQSPDGRLYPPLAPRLAEWEAATFTTGAAEVVAGCPHAREGHDFQLCTCGIRYAPDRSDFRRFADHLRETARLRPGWRVVEARGIADGRVDYDVTGSDGFFWAALAWRRCERFRIAELVG